MENFVAKEEDFGLISARMSKEYDYIIVGQGLAGTCLTSELIDLGKKVLVVDATDIPSSSEVAGGLFNPITGRKMVLTWKAHELFPVLNTFYTNQEHRLKTKLIHRLPLYRPFGSTEEINLWQGRMSEDKFKPFLDLIYSTPQYRGLVRNPIGGVLLKQTGYLDAKQFIRSFREYLIATDSFINTKFLLSDVNLYSENVVYKEHSAKKLILCDGPHGFANKIYEGIRFQPLKGEVLQLEMDSNAELIINRNAFVLPRDGNYIAGSNYDLMGLDWAPTELARMEIREKIEKILSKDYKIIGQRAGIRPTTHDRRPVIGLLPSNPRIGIFNGLGTKGVSLAPFFANQFADFLENGGEIEQEVRIGRYFD